MYDIKSYINANTVSEAVAALHANPNARVIAGGSDVLIRLRDGKMPAADLVCIRSIPELLGVTETAEGLRIGPATPFNQVAAHPLVQKYIPVLAEGVSQVGGPQVRNVGTVGGNISNGATSGDSAPALFALNAKLELISPEGKRIVPIAEFYKGPGKVDFKPAELLTAILVAKENYLGYRGQYIKYSIRKAMDISTLGVAAWCKMDGNKIADVRIAMGVAAPTPIRCAKAEALLVGAELNAAVIEQAATIAVTEGRPRTSWRATKEFRLQLIHELVNRAVAEAAKRAGGKI